VDEELKSSEPQHERVPADAAQQVAGKAALATAPGRMPAIYLGHGAPPLVDDPLWVVQLAAWAQAMPRPTAVLMVSAHWESAPLTIGATRNNVPLVYDFGGFAEKYYRAQYPAPGAPALAQRVRDLLGRAEPTVDQPDRGLDHGAYVPLTVMYPDADIPVLQISLPTLDPDRLLAIGARLAPLRERGVLIVGSGNIVHNLRALSWGQPDGAFDWNRRFDDAARVALTERPGEVPALRHHADYLRSAPTPEHFIPLLYIAGLASAANRPLASLIDGYAYGSLSMASYTLDGSCPTDAHDTRPAAGLPNPAGTPPTDTNL